MWRFFVAFGRMGRLASLPCCPYLLSSFGFACYHSGKCLLLVLSAVPACYLRVVPVTYFVYFCCVVLRCLVRTAGRIALAAAFSWRPRYVVHATLLVN